MSPAIPARSEPRVGLPPENTTPEKVPTVLYWFSLLLSHSRGILLAGFLGALISVGIRLVKPPVYSATALAVMNTPKPTSSLSGITAQLGLTTVGSDGSPNPFFYSDLLTSDLVLGSTVDSPYVYNSKKGTVRTNLATVLHASGSTPALRRERAIARLRKKVSARVTPKTGVISVTVTTEEPQLGPLIVARLLSEVNRINLLSRQSQAGGEREFTGRRAAEAAQELREAENALQDFLQRNRDYQSAPRTRIEEDRLARAVSMRQSIYTSVSEAHEQARIDEARDTPGLRVVEPATVPASPNRRGLPEAAALGLFVGFLVAVVWGIWKEYLEEIAERDPEQLNQYRQSLKQAGRYLTRPWRLLTGVRER